MKKFVFDLRKHWNLRVESWVGETQRASLRRRFRFFGKVLKVLMSTIPFQIHSSLALGWPLFPSRQDCTVHFSAATGWGAESTRQATGKCSFL
jgi:hypothetical protein